MNLFSILRQHLVLQVFLAIFLGVLVGVYWADIAVNLNFISIIFINLIKLIICPLIFVSIILGICQHPHQAGIGRLAVKTLVYFEVMSIVAIILAFFMMILLQPGANFNVSDMKSANIDQYLQLDANTSHSWFDFIIHIFPDSILGALAGHNLLPVIVLAVLFSLAILKMANKKNVVNALSTINELLFNLISLIVRLSPLAAFGAIANAVGQQGLEALYPLAKFVGCILFIMAAFCVLLTIVASLYGINVWKLLKHIREELVIAYATSSSESVFPQLMKKLESFGCSKSVVGFVLPTGYSFNLDGTAIYVMAGAMFIQQAYQIPLGLPEFALLIGIILITSKGAAGVTGAGFITLAATLSALPNHLLPVEGLALLLGIDRFMSDARTMGNLFGNSVGTVIIAKAQGEYHSKK